MKKFLNLISRLLIICLGSLLALSAQAHGFAVGELVVRHPYAAPTLAGVQNGAVYLKSIKSMVLLMNYNLNFVVLMMI